MLPVYSGEWDVICLMQIKLWTYFCGCRKLTSISKIQPVLDGGGTLILLEQEKQNFFPEHSGTRSTLKPLLLETFLNSGYK